MVDAIVAARQREQVSDADGPRQKYCWLPWAGPPPPHVLRARFGGELCYLLIWLSIAGGMSA